MLGLTRRVCRRGAAGGGSSGVPGAPGARSPRAVQVEVPTALATAAGEALATETPVSHDTGSHGLGRAPSGASRCPLQALDTATFRAVVSPRWVLLARAAGLPCGHLVRRRSPSHQSTLDPRLPDARSCLCRLSGSGDLRPAHRLSGVGMTVTWAGSRAGSSKGSLASPSLLPSTLAEAAMILLTENLLPLSVAGGP